MHAKNAHPPIDRAALTGKIRQWGKELGFSAIGITRAALSQEASSRLDRWLEQGRHGEMEYMSYHRELRLAPEKLLPGAISVISARLPYGPRAKDEKRAPASDDAYLARYARGRDYHRSVRQKLAFLVRRIAAELATTPSEPPFLYRAFADSAPVMEVELATQTGIAWRGKHTLSVSRQGSWHFLGEIYTSLDLVSDAPAKAHCGACTRCIEACPTSAILAPYELDARRCLSYLTIELRGPIPIPLRPLIGNRIFGCDDCQLCCPWNRFAHSGDPDFATRKPLEAARLIDLFAWEAQEFEQRLAGSPIRRIGHERWLRNIAVALGNTRPAAGVKALRTRADHPSALVREHVAWALSRFGTPQRV
jgi:epoxyqueuosine reductase